ncbi:MAG: glutathione S-transferase [Pseudomonadota bacterium]
MTRPILHTFSISHFSEKARWGLDWAGIDYELRPTIPIAHMLNARRLKVPQTSVPILEFDDAPPIQGSAAILDWAAEHGSLPSGAEDIEARVDAKLGRAIIYYFYGEAAIDQPATIPPLFTQGLTPGKARLFRVTWPAIRQLMIRGMGLSAQGRARARDKILTELDWLDAALSDGRPFFAGDAPGRGDIAAAALLAPLVQPPEHPVYGDHLTVPPLMAADTAAWRERPVMRLVARLYRAYR